MSRRFSEHTINGVTYHVEQDAMSGDWRVDGRWTMDGEKQGVAGTVYDRDARDECRDCGLDPTYENLEHAALRIGVTRLEPVVKARNEAIMLGMDRLFDPDDPEMDDSLADALKYGAPDWLQRERELERQEQERRKAEIAEKARQQAEKDRIERERREADTAAMESSELWGAF